MTDIPDPDPTYTGQLQTAWNWMKSVTRSWQYWWVLFLAYLVLAAGHYWSPSINHGTWIIVYVVGIPICLIICIWRWRGEDG